MRNRLAGRESEPLIVVGSGDSREISMTAELLQLAVLAREEAQRTPFEKHLLGT